MRTIIQNFLNIFRRFKTATLLNILGLSVAFAAFLIILMQVSYETSYDKCHPTAKHVYRIDLDGDGYMGLLSRAMINGIKQFSPHIKVGTLLNQYSKPVYITVSDEKGKRGYRESVAICEPEIIQVFDFPIIEGDRNCLKDPEKVLIPQSLAIKLFGQESAVGKSFHTEESIFAKDGRSFTVGAVYKDFPSNTQLRNTIFIPIDEHVDIQNWGQCNYIGYVLIEDENAVTSIEEDYSKHFDFTKLRETGNDKEIKLKLTHLTDIYFLKENQNVVGSQKGNIETAYILLFIAVLIIAIAIINFVNFSMALVPSRVKGINTHKVLGGTDTLLRNGLLLESVSISLLSYLISLCLISAINSLNLFSFLEINTQLSNHQMLLLLTGGLSVLIGFIAGVYPSYYITSFPPAMVLKGNFGLSPKGRTLRTALIVFQFVISIILIVVSLFIQLQNNYMQNYKLGFEKEQIAIVELTSDFCLTNKDAFINRLKSYSGIDDIAFSLQKLGSEDGYQNQTITYKEQNIHVFTHAVSANFFSVMGIQLMQGREPVSADEKGEGVTVYVNQKLHDQYQLSQNDGFEMGGGIAQVAGVTDNIQFTSLRNEVYNTIFYVNKMYPLPISYIRLKAGIDYTEAVNHIQETMKSIDPTFPYEVEFYDTFFDNFYHQEQKMSKLITWFSILSFLISLVGIFGLVLFETQYRIKEIGVRKVFGATIQEILILFNRIYMHIVCVSFAIAVPIGYYFVTKWLEKFAYKTPVYWWVFGIAFVVIAAITLSTVSFQNWRAASVNPVDSIKSE